MAQFEIIMPKLGESIIEATITRWIKSPGDHIEEEDALAEIATDKVDSEIPSPVDGTLLKVLFKEGDVVPVGEVIAVIEIAGEAGTVEKAEAKKPAVKEEKAAPEPVKDQVAEQAAPLEDFSGTTRFYSPLVKSIAKQEGITLPELNSIKGSGKDDRVTKTDVLDYLSHRPAPGATKPAGVAKEMPKPAKMVPGTEDRVIEMDRMRKLIADHMVMSVQTSPHVTSFVEVDMTNIVNWRNKVKGAFEKRENIRITFTHMFIEAIAKTIKEYPMVNSSVDGDRIIMKKNINIGVAVALPSDNLIVPVLKRADEKSLLGIAKEVNDLAEKARTNKLQPDDIQGGTITLTNLGSFGTVLGTPIINQPQVAIVAVGTITKRPVVIETPQGDMIGIRHMMYLSLSYDHRIVDGALGGKFIYRVKEHLEDFDTDRTI